MFSRDDCQTDSFEFSAVTVFFRRLLDDTLTNGLLLLYKWISKLVNATLILNCTMDTMSIVQ